MKPSKKVLAAVCAFAMLAGASTALPQGFDRLGASLGVRARDNYRDNNFGDYYYIVLDDGTVEITGYSGSGTEAIIPSEIDGRKVTSIGYSAFEAMSHDSYQPPSTNLTSITIPDGVTRIGSGAFYDCVNLKIINIPDSVTTIEGMAFFGCQNLESIIIPDGVTSIGNNTFTGCISLTSVTIPNSVRSIGIWAFAGCGFTSITIPEGVKSIAKQAFMGSGLTSMTIPKSVEYIDEMAFGYWHNADTGKYEIVPGFKVFCYEGTFGEQYAKDYGYDYELISDFLPGDANKDKKVNMKDLVLIQRYLNGWAVDIDIDICDLNGDNKVNMKDYVALQRILNGWT